MRDEVVGRIPQVYFNTVFAVCLVQWNCLLHYKIFQWKSFKRSNHKITKLSTTNNYTNLQGMQIFMDIINPLILLSAAH